MPWYSHQSAGVSEIQEEFDCALVRREPCLKVFCTVGAWEIVILHIAKASVRAKHSRVQSLIQLYLLIESQCMYTVFPLSLLLAFFVQLITVFRGSSVVYSSVRVYVNYSAAVSRVSSTHSSLQMGKCLFGDEHSPRLEFLSVSLSKCTIGRG